MTGHGSTITFYPTCPFGQVIIRLTCLNINFTCPIFYQECFDSEFFNLKSTVRAWLFQWENEVSFLKAFVTTNIEHDLSAVTSLLRQLFQNIFASGSSSHVLWVSAYSYTKTWYSSIHVSWKFRFLSFPYSFCLLSYRVFINIGIEVYCLRTPSLTTDKLFIDRFFNDLKTFLNRKKHFSIG